MTTLLTPRRAVAALALIATLAVLSAACGGDDTDTADGALDGDAAAAPTADEGSSGEDADGGATDDGGDAGDPADDAADDPADDAADPEAEASSGGFPVDIDTASGVVTIESAPTRIVSLSPTATEILFAVGAGDRVVAVDMFSNHPPEAPQGTLDGFAPDLESILVEEPDLVVASGLPEDVAVGLSENGVPVVIQPAAATFDDTFDQVAELGQATGEIDGAAAVNAEIRRGIDDVVAGLDADDGSVRVFHEIDDSFYTATSDSFIGQVYAALGFENVADPLDDGSGFPLVDGEAVIAADPSLIVYTDQVTYDADDIAARPGWDGITAVRTGRIVEVDADIASRWGPRVVEFMQAVADAMAGADA